MIFIDPAVTQFTHDGHYIQWRWDPQATDPDTVELEIMRSESPDGPFDTVATIDPRDVFSYFDKTSPTSLLNAEIFYRLRAVERGTDREIKVSQAFGTQGKPPLDALEIIRQQRILLEGVNGHQPRVGIPGGVTCYRKRNFGRRCPECVDAVTGRVAVSNCRLCIGTGKLDGYYNPVNVGMNIQPYAVVAKLEGLQRNTDVDTAATMNNYPTMFPGDIIVEPSEKHWRVTRLDTKERHRIVVRQILSLSQIKPDDIINEILRHVSHGGKKI